MDPTLRFQQALPYALLPLSPQLSALHSSRVRARTSLPSPPYFCSRCGHHLSFTTHVRAKRPKRPASTRITCVICLHIQDTEVNVQKELERPETQSTSIIPSELSSDGERELQSSKSQPISTENPKSRLKKRSMLQEMLLRNKNKATKVQEPSQGSGLAQFLSGL